MKRLFLGLITILLFCAISVSIAAASERTWCFMDDEFADIEYGTLESDVTVDGLTISKNMKMVKVSKNVRNVEFTKAIYTYVSGNTSNGYIKFYVNGDTDIHVLACDETEYGTSYGIYLWMYSEASGESTGLTIKELNDYVYEYRGDAGYIYLYSNDVSDYLRLFRISAKDYDESEYESLEDGEKIEWDFDDYSSLKGSIAENTEIDGLNVYATDTYPVEIGSSSIYSEYGNTGMYYVNLMGSGQYDSRFISFAVPENSDIYVTARSSDGESERQLIVRNTYFGKPDTNLEEMDFSMSKLLDTYVNVTGDLDTYKISYYGSGEDFVLNSADSGIRIYKITIVPRIDTVISKKEWNISTNSNFAVGSYSDTTVDGLYMYNAAVEECSIDDYSKRIYMKSGLYTGGKATKLKFNVSDSSGERGSRTERTISVTANTNTEGTIMALVNAEDYLIGCVELSTDITEYQFTYNGTYDEICVYTYYPHNAQTAYSYIYKLDNGKSDITGPDDTERTVSVTKGQEYQYYFVANNISTDGFTYKITYNADALNVKYVGYGNGSDDYSTEGLNIIENSDGIIEYTIDKSYDNWSGVTVSVIFEAKSTGNTTIGYIAEVN